MQDWTQKTACLAIMEPKQKGPSIIMLMDGENGHFITLTIVNNTCRYTNIDIKMLLQWTKTGWPTGGNLQATVKFQTKEEKNNGQFYGN